MFPKYIDKPILKIIRKTAIVIIITSLVIRELTTIAEAFTAFNLESSIAVFPNSSAFSINVSKATFVFSNGILFFLFNKKTANGIYNHLL